MQELRDQASDLPKIFFFLFSLLGLHLPLLLKYFFGNPYSFTCSRYEERTKSTKMRHGNRKKCVCIYYMYMYMDMDMYMYIDMYMMVRPQVLKRTILVSILGLCGFDEATSDANWHVYTCIRC